METEDLIRRLGRRLAPVRPLAPPWTRAARWLACGGAYLGAALLAAWVRGRPFGIAGAGGVAYLAQQVTLVATAVATAFAAFASVIPGANRRLVGASMLPAGAAVAALLWSCLADVRLLGTLGAGRETDWPCVVSIAVGGIALWALATVMLRRGAPLTPRLSSLLGGIAALSIANLEACLLRPHAFNITILLWHGATTVLVTAGLVYVGPRLLRWKTLGL